MTGGYQRYAELTGRQLTSEQLDFYRLRWDLADLCSYGSWFYRPHEATPDIQLGWRGAVAICARVSAGTPGPPWAQQSESPASSTGSAEPAESTRSHPLSHGDVLLRRGFVES